MGTPGISFGIYPMSMAGTPKGLAVGPPDQPEAIKQALATLRGTSRTLMPRNYLVYTGPHVIDKLFARADEYERDGMLCDLTIGTLDPNPEQGAWLELVRQIVRRYGSELTTLQITNEPNLTFMEGANPHIVPALVQGVKTAKAEARQANFSLKIGFGSVPDAGPVLPNFWEDLAVAGDEEFLASVDYVGHNFYIDVFEEPLALADIPVAVERVLRRLREVHLPTVNIPATVPIHVTENGWPTGRHPFTGAERPYERQATVLESVIRTVYALRADLNITHYELFGLRDADSNVNDMFHQFGILRDDYTPKPAFAMFQGLIQELGI